MTGLAHAPYSQVRVGAAGLVDDGRTVVGCNVENPSLGLSLCAECGLVGHLFSSGGGRLVAVAVVGADGLPMAPCGRCRQVLLEAGGPDLLVATARGVVPLATLLPDPFGPEELAPGARSRS
jgi:cytidine deaminase